MEGVRAMMMASRILGRLRMQPRAMGHPLQPSSIRAFSGGDHALEKSEVIDRVIEVIKAHGKVTDPSKVTPTAQFQDLGLDSLDIVEVVMSIEEEFSLQIPDLEADKIVSLPQAVDYICAHPMSK